MIVTIDQLVPLGIAPQRVADFMATYGNAVEVTRERLLSPPLRFVPGLIARLCPPGVLASFHAAIQPCVDERKRLDDENRAAEASGRIGHDEYLREELAINDDLRDSCAHCLADVLGLPMTGDGRPVATGCRHEYVNVGFTSVTMACRHCGAKREDRG